MQTQKRLLQALLHHVFRILAVFRDSLGDCENALLVLSDKFVEGFVIATFGSGTSICSRALSSSNFSFNIEQAAGGTRMREFQ